MSAQGVVRVLTESLEGAGVQIVSDGLTDVGRVRANNEDSFRILEPLHLFLLSDGMGGEAHGEIARPSVDIYALGNVMYEMVTGHTPFDGDSPVAVAMKHIQEKPVPPSQINPTVPVSLEEIILRCLEKEPEMRFRDGSQLARALESIM